MGVADITDPEAVRAAIAEFDDLGREPFLGKYGFAPAREYFILERGRYYDSKAVLGAAHGFQHSARGPLRHSEFSGGEQTTARLAALGFATVRLAALTTAPSGRPFGHIPGFPPGSVFASRRELADAGVHRPVQAGISGSGTEGADSIVVSGGYEDDRDDGRTLIYTGQGGNDPATKTQVADQEFVRGNLALARSCDEGLPVRVIRGAIRTRGRHTEPSVGPRSGFRYDGLYRVADYWHDIGKSGFRVYLFRLTAIEGETTFVETVAANATQAPAMRAEVMVQRIVRNTAMAQRVKQLHGHRCQVCGLIIDTPSGLYAEGAHIRGLGRPHNGPDVESNLLCLCPNHHVLFDKGGFVIEDDLTVRSTATGESLGRLRTVSGHAPSFDFVRYHREHVGA